MYAFMFSGLFLTSCQKEQVETDLDSKVVDEQNLELNQQNADKAKVLHFIDKLKNGHSPSDIGDRDAPLTVDEVAFGSEAVLNLYYSRFEDRFKEMDYAEVELNVPLMNGVVDDAELAGAYASIEEVVTNHLDSAPYANKKVGYVDVIVTEVSSNEATIRVKTAIGGLEVGPSDPNDPVAQPPYFDTDDNWRCGLFMFGTETVNAVGKCDGTEPTLDAAQLLMSTLNSQYRLDHPFPLIYHGVYGFQVNSDAHILLLDAENEPTKFFNAPYLGSGNLSNLCINESDMNLFYGNYDNEIAIMETTIWQLDNPTFFPGESGWKFKMVSDLRTRWLPTQGEPNMLKHVADLLFMKQIIIYDDGGSNIDASTTSNDPITWVEDLLD